ncbi:HAMP domain-containing protein [Thalassococcus sp. BH17M4-6]|uniref:HAMP domain-containing protein n=1 Tax=Thalassococcus sp. BH17M4-6 TaxID=3413148 RepID=UPI003BBD8924
MIDQNSPSIGRFDKSFLIHMIRDFFLILVLVTVLEFSLKAALVYYDYRANGTEQAEEVAQDLAENVRSIMRNEGGPVAARTMYPILNENWTNLGYAIAIEPAPVTVRSIEQNFDFTPQGIPGDDWPAGRYQAASVDVRAEPFCLACHTEAQVGDVLGTVTVRTYLAEDFAKWFQDIRLTAILAAGKIVLHSFLLLLILRARMQPLWSLRSVVSNLARAYGRLDHRAEIRTSDEFGVLARDLNLFLDRITQIVAELDTVLAKVVSANDAIIAVQGDLRRTVDEVASGLRQLERDAMLGAKREPRLSQAWFTDIRATIADLDDGLADRGGAEAATALLGNLRDVVANAEAQIAASEAMFTRLADLGDRSEALKGSMIEMTRLEERLQGIIETCSTLVRRLRTDRDRRDS